MFVEETVVFEEALDSESRSVLIVVAPDPEADSEEAERLAR